MIKIERVNEIEVLKIQGLFYKFMSTFLISYSYNGERESSKNE